MHKTVRYFKRTASAKVQRKDLPTVSGLVFFQGLPKDIQAYLDRNFPNTHLCKNCSTGRVAVISDSQMRPFMRINQTEPERIRFLLKPFHYYARNRILLRITSGELAGLEGYIIRIDRDRRLVMDVGGLSVAVSGIHAEHFEEVEQDKASASDENIFYKRNLHERQVLIDYLRKYVLEELSRNRLTLNAAWSICSFIIEEINYYYAPFIEQFKEDLDPIMSEGGKVIQMMDSILSNPVLDVDTKDRFQSELEKLTLDYNYLF